MNDSKYDVLRAASPVSEFDEIVDSERLARPDKEIGLCLSGGGYRAMLFHVGAILRLNEARLLPRLGRVSSVSGGSITAAVLGMHWTQLDYQDDVAGNLTELLVEPIRAIAARTIDRKSILGGIFLPGTISQRVAKAYNRILFQGRTLQDLPDYSEGPLFVFNATSVQTSALVRFSRPFLADYKVGMIKKPAVRLADAVAASSAFPPFLSPCTIPVDPADFDNSSAGELHQKPFTEKFVLADGGVYDNLGIETVWKQLNLVLISDGGGQMQPDGKPASDWARHSKRIMELLDNQVRSLRKRQIISGFASSGDPHTGTYWGIRSDISHYGLPDVLPCPHTQTLGLANTPTRLKYLAVETQNRLMNWGYAICDAALRKHFADQLPVELDCPTDFPFANGLA